jgi:hypothetical protein
MLPAVVSTNSRYGCAFRSWHAAVAAPVGPVIGTRERTLGIDWSAELELNGAPDYHELSVRLRPRTPYRNASGVRPHGQRPPFGLLREELLRELHRQLTPGILHALPQIYAQYPVTGYAILERLVHAV